MRIGRSIDSYFFSSFPPPSVLSYPFSRSSKIRIYSNFNSRGQTLSLRTLFEERTWLKSCATLKEKKKTPRSDKFLRSRNHKSENKRRRTVWLKTRVPLKSRCAMRKARVWMRNRQKPQRIAVLVTRFCQSTRRNSIPGRRSRRLLPPLPPFPLEKKESGIEARLQEAVLTGPF